ncbi:hypothetical protein ACFV7R_32835 [Streptomyces sp. NPDC059866]|uniref:hypothetical protein n=1 Tax=Streptomyces sp. NPDC059866 TaxID=3346978 RepID=UPI00366296BE
MPLRLKIDLAEKPPGPERASSPFLVDAASGLEEEALAGEASEAASSDDQGRVVGRHAEEFV